MAEITKKEVCKCENCGNEAEMMVTCTLPDIDEGADAPASAKKSTEKVKGTATCTQCGNEADMWIDI